MTGATSTLYDTQCAKVITLLSHTSCTSHSHTWSTSYAPCISHAYGLHLTLLVIHWCETFCWVSPPAVLIVVITLCSWSIMIPS